MKRPMFIFVFLVIFVLASNVAQADSIDISASLNNLYLLSLNVVPEVAGNIAVVGELAMQSHKSKIDSKGDMTNSGDYEIWEGGKHHFTLGLGYEVGEFLTPWVAASSYSIKTTKHEMKTNNSQISKTTTDITDPVSGVAFGLNAEYWMDNFGAYGTLAKIPKGAMITARLKYKVTEIGTAHIGYSYSSYFGNSIMAGLGVSY